jgi:adenine deaminase
MTTRKTETMTTPALLTRMIMAGQGKEPADLVIRNVGMLDVITGAITTTDIAIVADRIVGTHARYEGNVELDGTGRFAVPGFIDTHLHIESSLVTPLEFDRSAIHTRSPMFSAPRAFAISSTVPSTPSWMCGSTSPLACRRRPSRPRAPSSK